MHRGCDKGFCISYWRLSYRRKCFRTIWTTLIGLIIVAALFAWRSGEVSRPVYSLLAALLALGVLQAVYNYWRWQKEVRSGRLP